MVNCPLRSSSERKDIVISLVSYSRKRLRQMPLGGDFQDFLSGMHRKCWFRHPLKQGRNSFWAGEAPQRGPGKGKKLYPGENEKDSSYLECRVASIPSHWEGNLKDVNLRTFNCIYLNGKNRWQGSYAIFGLIISKCSVICNQGF